jgi:hypothetical protein
MKRITKVVLSIAALAAITVGASFATAKNCCPNGLCCNGSCCKLKHNAK